MRLLKKNKLKVFGNFTKAFPSKAKWVNAFSLVDFIWWLKIKNIREVGGKGGGKGSVIMSFLVFRETIAYNDMIHWRNKIVLDTIWLEDNKSYFFLMFMVLYARVSLHLLLHLWSSLQSANKRLNKYLLQINKK